MAVRGPELMYKSQIRHRKIPVRRSGFTNAYFDALVYERSHADLEFFPVAIVDNHSGFSSHRNPPIVILVASRECVDGRSCPRKNWRVCNLSPY